MPLHAFGVLLLIPTAFALLNLEDLLNPKMFGFGVDLPISSRFLFFAESTLALLSFVLAAKAWVKKIRYRYALDCTHSILLTSDDFY
ncbi:MAG: hypothetical protein ACREQ8_14770 [Woeseiaceae bacterium]